MPLSKYYEAGTRVYLDPQGERYPAIIVAVKYDHFEKIPLFTVYRLRDQEIFQDVLESDIGPIPWELLPDPNELRR